MGTVHLKGKATTDSIWRTDPVSGQPYSLSPWLQHHLAKFIPPAFWLQPRRNAKMSLPVLTSPLQPWSPALPWVQRREAWMRQVRQCHGHLFLGVTLGCPEAREPGGLAHEASQQMVRLPSTLPMLGPGGAQEGRPTPKAAIRAHPTWPVRWALGSVAYFSTHIA